MPAHLTRLQAAVSSLLQRDRLPELSRFTDLEATMRSANAALGTVSAAIGKIEHQSEMCREYNGRLAAFSSLGRCLMSSTKPRPCVLPT